jgi:hypothetical protein
MVSLLSLLVCLAAQPHVCETVTPDVVRANGAPPSFFECLGAPGQEIARYWLAENPSYVLRRVQCSMGNDPQQLREMVVQPEA